MRSAEAALSSVVSPEIDPALLSDDLGARWLFLTATSAVRLREVDPPGTRRFSAAALPDRVVTAAPECSTRATRLRAGGHVDVEICLAGVTGGNRPPLRPPRPLSRPPALPRCLLTASCMPPGSCRLASSGRRSRDWLSASTCARTRTSRPLSPGTADDGDPHVDGWTRDESARAQWPRQPGRPALPSRHRRQVPVKCVNSPQRRARGTVLRSLGVRPPG